MGIVLALSWLIVLPNLLLGQLRISKDESPQRLFAGEGRSLQVTLQNPDSETIEVSLRTQIYQTTSATAIPLGQPQDWKRLQVLPHQTVRESVSLSFPSVLSGTRFLVRWMDDQNKVVGNSSVMVYPTNLLKALGPLAGEKPLGLFDPQGQLKPLLKASGLEFEDLEETGLRGFSGKLAIVGPAEAKEESAELVGQMASLAKSGVGVVWIQRPSNDSEELEPSLYPVSVGRGAITIVRPKVISRIGENPTAQLNLIRSAELALNPDLLSLPLSKP